MYKKPVNKHQCLLYDSNHPCHLKDSLIYSAGIRILRNFSDTHLASIELSYMFNEFSKRNYPKHVILKAQQKLSLLSRDEILRPKKDLLIRNLRIHNPHILSKFNVKISENPQSRIPNNKIFITMPFYESIPCFSTIVQNALHKACKNSKFKQIIDETKIIVSFKIVNNLSSFIK